jgi:hypothetical protein
MPIRKRHPLLSARRARVQGPGAQIVAVGSSLHPPQSESGAGSPAELMHVVTSITMPSPQETEQTAFAGAPLVTHDGPIRPAAQPCTQQPIRKR